MAAIGYICGSVGHFPTVTEDNVTNNRFNVSSGTVVWIRADRGFGLLVVTTPNGTSSPDTEYCFFQLDAGRMPNTALEVSGANQNLEVHFSQDPSPPIKVGDELYFREYRDTTDPLRSVGTWCLANEFHRKLELLDELWVIVPDPEASHKFRVVAKFRNVLEVHELITARGLVQADDWQWQRRPGPGKRDYPGICGEEITRGWENCSAPI